MSSTLIGLSTSSEALNCLVPPFTRVPFLVTLLPSKFWEEACVDLLAMSGFVDDCIEEVKAP